MPIVIDLISSPIDTRPKTTHAPPAARPRAKSPDVDIFNFHSDDFKFTGLSDDLDVAGEQPKKKCRLSPLDRKRGGVESLRRWSFLSSDGPREEMFTVRADDTSKNISTIAKTDNEDLPSDPITFSSSAPEAHTVRRIATSAIIDLEADTSGHGDVFSLTRPLAPARTYLSERTANLLANITVTGRDSSQYKCAVQSVKTRHPSVSTTSLQKRKRSTDEDERFTSSPPKAVGKFSRTLSKDQGAREAEKVATRAKKEAEKQAESERKRLARERKAQEKQLAADIAQVNKSKIDKKDSTPEMILDMSRPLEGSHVGNQVLEYMNFLGVETTFFDEWAEMNENGGTVNRSANVVRWRRKVKAKYDEDVGHWLPTPVEEIETEKHTLVHLTARDFLEIAASGVALSQEPATRDKAMMENLDAHVGALRRRYRECKPIYLIEGLSAFVRKNKNAKNRAYTAAVRSQIAGGSDQPNPPAPASNQPRRRKKNTDSDSSSGPSPIDLSFVDEDTIESLLLHLQLHQREILIHQSANASLSAEWIKTFTEHISTIPYRHVRLALNDAVGFCMDVGQVKTGDDRLDTYVKMLQEVQRLTPAMAYGIANRYDTLGKLIGAFRRDGPSVLQHIKKSANRDGAVTDRVLGPAISKRLYKVCMGTDPWSMDGIA